VFFKSFDTEAELGHKSRVLLPERQKQCGPRCCCTLGVEYATRRATHRSSVTAQKRSFICRVMVPNGTGSSTAHGYRPAPASDSDQTTIQKICARGRRAWGARWTAVVGWIFDLGDGSIRRMIYIYIYNRMIILNIALSLKESYNKIQSSRMSIFNKVSGKPQ
jgi:hypothetical protein